MTGGITYTPSHTNVCKFLNFQPIFFFQPIFGRHFGEGSIAL